MPYITLVYLGLILVWGLLARYCTDALWPVARNLLSLGFLLWWQPRAAGAMVALSLVTWLAGELRGRWLFWAGLVLMGGAFLGVRVAQREELPVAMLAPVGFGFLVLRWIHYWLERWRGALPPHGPMDLLGWLIYFPTVLVGPVQRFDDWLRWERRRRWDEGDAARGVKRVLYGYFRVVVLSFWLLGSVLPQHLLGVPDALTWTVLGAASLYLTFSGLSSLAIGLGDLAGQRVPENFASPFTQTSLPAFWRSWHMTVSGWCRTYVYFPVLARTRRPLLSAGSAMAFFALWHELSVAYLAWGAWHGLGLALWGRLVPGELSRGQKPLGWAVTMGWVMAGFYLLRAWPRGAMWYAR